VPPCSNFGRQAEVQRCPSLPWADPNEVIAGGGGGGGAGGGWGGVLFSFGWHDKAWGGSGFEETSRESQSPLGFSGLSEHIER